MSWSTLSIPWRILLLTSKRDWSYFSHCKRIYLGVLSSLMNSLSVVQTDVSTIDFWSNAGKNLTRAGVSVWTTWRELINKGNIPQEYLFTTGEILSMAFHSEKGFLKKLTVLINQYFIDQRIYGAYKSANISWVNPSWKLHSTWTLWRSV